MCVLIRKLLEDSENFKGKKGRHTGIMGTAGCDIITSWNFKHIVNVKTVRGVKTITTLEGYKDLLIYPPSVLLKGDDENDETYNK